MPACVKSFYRNKTAAKEAIKHKGYGDNVKIVPCESCRGFHIQRPVKNAFGRKK